MRIRELLDEVMPELGLDPRGYKNVRRTVMRRVARRIGELALVDAASYRELLAASEEERVRLAAMCRIPISRLWRDADVFARISHELLPARAAAARAEGRDAVRVWSAGCASGEEPVSVVLAWQAGAASRAAGTRLDVLATDADADAIARAMRAVYTESSASELPAALREAAFGAPGVCSGRVRDDLLARVEFHLQDLRHEVPPGPFDLVLCRNVAFTYFDDAGRRAVAARISGALRPGGFLVVGKGEAVPADVRGLREWAPLVYLREG